MYDVFRKKITQTLHKLIYNKELTGRQLHRDEIDNATLQKWFNEWNQLQQEIRSNTDFIPTHMIDNIINHFFEQFRKRKQMEKQLRGIGPGQKKFDTVKLEGLIQNLRSNWSMIKKEIIENKLTVSTIQRYFAMLATEDKNNICNEVNFMLQSMQQSEIQQINVENISKNIVMVFECLSSLNAAKILRDTTIKEYGEYGEVITLLLKKNIIYLIKKHFTLLPA